MRLTSFSYLFILFSCLINNQLQGAQPDKQTREEYIAHYATDAVREMKKSGIPASITLAQACLESSDGNSPLAVEANNHFGIKCANWTGPGYYQDDDAPNECFRKYSSAFESFDDHSNFLKSRPRYAALFELDPTDYKSWAHGLRKAGYATDPRYADRLIKIIEEYNLHQLDLGNNLSAPTASVVISPPVSHSVKNKQFDSQGEQTVSVFKDRTILKKNNISCITARSGDSFKTLAEEFHLGYWQLPKYNELSMNTALKQGQVIYLAPKRRSAAVPNYTVQEGDDIHSIAQQLGIKSKFIRKYNGLSENQPLTPGVSLVVSR